MPTFEFKFAYDIPCYASLDVTAKSYAAAEKKIREGWAWYQAHERKGRAPALAAEFHALQGEPDWNESFNFRVFDENNIGYVFNETPGGEDSPMRNFVDTIARMLRDGESTEQRRDDADGGAHEFELTIDDAIDTVHLLINRARELTGIKPDGLIETA